MPNSISPLSMPHLRGFAPPPWPFPFLPPPASARPRSRGPPASLDALCRRFAIDLSVREKHGADIDCGLLASVYLELLGGRQPALALVADAADAALDQEQAALRRKPRPPRPHRATEEELKAHRAMLEVVKSPLWLAPGSD